jgi:ADP-ribose pyrophosphatase YjhB (NUDIX family)
VASSQIPQVAVGAIVVSDGALLMVQRGREPAKGLWSIPGGRVEFGEYLAGALTREVKEETGLDIEVGDLIGIAEVVGDPHYVILDFGAKIVGNEVPTPSGDVADARWVTFDEVLTLPCTPRFVELMQAWQVLPSPNDDSLADEKSD